MANKKFWVGILAMVLVFGMAVIGCDTGNDDNGTVGGPGLTITGIPPEHDGHHILFMCDWSSTVGAGRLARLWGMVSINMHNEIITKPRISGGSVTIPIWTQGAGDNFERFSGNINDVIGGVLITTSVL